MTHWVKDALLIFICLQVPDERSVWCEDFVTCHCLGRVEEREGAGGVTIARWVCPQSPGNDATGSADRPFKTVVLENVNTFPTLCPPVPSYNWEL